MWKKTWQAVTLYKAYEIKYILWLTESILTTASEVYREGRGGGGGGGGHTHETNIKSQLNLSS